jgi:hypothetical protein
MPKLSFWEHRLAIFFCLPICANGRYMSFSGDAIGATAVEYFVINLGQSYADFAWSESTTIRLKAAWYGDTDDGLAFVDLSTFRYLPGGTVVLDDNEISVLIDPTFYQNAVGSLPRVATASVDFDVDGTVVISVTA